MQWAEPQWLWALLLVPALSLLYGWHWWWKNQVARKLGNARLLARRSGRKQVLQFVLVMMALALSVVALARPQWGERARTVKREGIDVVLALDISRSMLAADVNPNRLRAAKDELTRVMKQLRGDRVGLVVFTGVSFAQAPLTTDYGAVKFYLRKLDPSDMPVGGTASGRALIDSIELLTGERIGRQKKEDDESLKPDNQIKRAKTQVVVLITDGEDHQGDPVAAAELAKERGIRVYTVGFGSAEGVPIPIVDQKGGRARYLRDRKGNTVYTRLNDGPLKEIAQMTGGQYFHYSDRGSIANAITQTLNELEKEELASLLRVEGEDRFHFFLFPALVLLLLATLLGERRGVHPAFWLRHRVTPGRHGDETQFEKMAKVLLLAPVVALAIGSQGCDTMYETFVRTKAPAVERGNQHIESGESAEALASYKAAAEQIPSSPGLFYDLGIGFLENTESDQAVANLSRSLESSDPELRFKALFHMGITHFRQEKWPEALEAFKGALKIKPDNMDAKVAFEVALMKVYPPCSALEDPLEDNDEREAATKMEEPEQKELTLCGEDEDWFAVPIYAGSIIRATATFTRLREREPGDPEMLPEPGMLRLVLFGPDGETVLGLSQDNPEDMKPPKEGEEKAERAIGPLKLTADMLEIAPGSRDLGQAFLRVVADGDLEFKYDVKLEVIPPCFAMEDDYEDNDSLEAAKPLQNSAEPQKLRVCEDDEDWFTYDVQPGDDLFIDVMSEMDAERQRLPVLDLALMDETGQEVLSTVEEVQTPAGRIYGVKLRGITEPRKVALRVRGMENKEQGPYSVSVYHYKPCGQSGGDDRLEENDRPEAATELPRGQGPVRHLRYCPGDPDFLKFAAQKDDQIQLGLAHEEFEDDPPAPPAPMVFRLLNAGGDTVVTDGQVIQVAPPQTSPIQQALGTEKIEEEEVSFMLEVDSPVMVPRFYSIIPLDGDKSQPPPQENQPQDGEQDDEENEDQEGDQEQSDQGDEGDKQQEPSEQDEPQDGEQESGQEEEEATPEEERREAIEQLLENLEDNDDNFQLKKALEDVPDRYIENDW